MFRYVTNVTLIVFIVRSVYIPSIAMRAYILFTPFNYTLEVFLTSKHKGHAYPLTVDLS